MSFRERALDEVLDFFDYQRIPVSTLERDKRKGEYRYYGAQGVIDYIDDYIFDGEYVLVAEDGANLVTRSDPIAFVVDGKFWVNNHAHIVRGREDEADNRYLCWLLNNLNIAGYVTGAAQPKLSQKSLRAIKISLPPLPVQRRITSILAAYDDLAENNRRRIALLEESARLLYREWFVRLRFPGHEHTRIVDGVPEGWEKIPVPEAIDINPSTPLSDEDEHCWVEMADLSDNSMLVGEPIRREGRSGSKFRNGDTLFARITPCLENGKTGYVNFLQDGEVARGSTEFIVLRSKRLTPEYVYCLARTYTFREHAIKSMVGSSGRQRVQVSCFDEFLVWLPSQTLLNLFQDFAAPSFQEIRILRQQNLKLQSARDLLLPRLMRGEIAV